MTPITVFIYKVEYKDRIAYSAELVHNDATLIDIKREWYGDPVITEILMMVGYDYEFLKKETINILNNLKIN